MPVKRTRQAIDEGNRPPTRTTPRAPRTTLPAPPRNPGRGQMGGNPKQKPMYYVPPGTNEVWLGSSYQPNPYSRITAGRELLDESGAPYPYFPPAAPAAPGGGGGEAVAGPVEATPAAVPITWSEKYQLPGSPEYWRGMMPSQWTPETELAAMSNALMPYLSPEDQRALGSNLSRMFPDAFGSYSSEKTQFPQPATSLTPPTSSYFQSAQRATDILSALDKMKEASGQEESKFGPGYQYLRQLASTMKDFGAVAGAQNMSRRQMVNLFGALDPLLAESKGQQLGAYEGLAKSMTQPFFTAAQLLNVGKDESGNWVFGKANKSWF